STRVDLVGGDADFGAEAIFEAVGKAGGGVDHHRAGVDLTQEAAAAGVVLGDDGVSVLRAVAADVLDRRIDAVDHADGEDRRQVFGLPVGLGGGVDVRHNGTSALA